MIKGFYFITDGRLSTSGNISDVKNAISVGVQVIQYRCTNETDRQMFEECNIIKKLCKKKDVIFIINNRIDIVFAVDADGVHLGQKDLPIFIARKILGKNKIIGISINSLKQANQAYKQGSDYIGIGPIFSTNTKPDAGKPVGINIISKIKKSISIPIVAIGGINIANAPYVIQAGSDALCAISEVLTKKNIKKEIEKFQSLF
jgi:thiamine-phosphate pyrophosphorylase